jgi:two-component system sensor histidine kinase HydH
VRANNIRALGISAVGSVLLAGLGGYLLKLHDRARILQLALAQRRHLAYVGTISAGLAHEIRNPLSSVKMNVQMIRDRLEKLDVDDRESLLRKIERVSRETNRLEESVGDFLVFAAPRPLKKRPADINALVDSVVELLRQQQESAEIVKSYSPDLPEVEIDQDMFTEVLQNLIINAFQATNGNGTVEVATLLESNRLAVTVSDSGPGVPEDQREKIFEVFYTTKKGGTGLGLSIAKRITEEHGGSIVLESSSLGGAQFVVRLPLNSKT